MPGLTCFSSKMEIVLSFTGGVLRFEIMMGANIRTCLPRLLFLFFFLTYRVPGLSLGKYIAFFVFWGVSDTYLPSTFNQSKVLLFSYVA